MVRLECKNAIEAGSLRAISISNCAKEHGLGVNEPRHETQWGFDLTSKSAGMNCVKGTFALAINSGLELIGAISFALVAFTSDCSLRRTTKGGLR